MDEDEDETRGAAARDDAVLRDHAVLGEDGALSGDGVLHDDAVLRVDVAEALATLGLAPDGPVGGAGPWFARTGAGDEHLVTATRVADEPAWERLRRRTTALLDLAHEAVVPLLGALPVGDRSERAPRTVVLVWARPDDDPVPVRTADDVVALVVAASRAVVAARTCGVHLPGDDAVEALRVGPGGLPRLWLGPWWDASAAPCEDAADATRAVAAAVALRVARAGAELPRALLDLLADGVGPRAPAPGTFAARALESLGERGPEAAPRPDGVEHRATSPRGHGADGGPGADAVRVEDARPSETPTHLARAVDWRALVTAGPPQVVPPRGARRRARPRERVPVPVVAEQRPALPRPSASRPALPRPTTSRSAQPRPALPRPAGRAADPGRPVGRGGAGAPGRAGPNGVGGPRRASVRVLAALAVVGTAVGAVVLGVLVVLPSVTGPDGSAAPPGTPGVRLETPGPGTGVVGGAQAAEPVDVLESARRATLGRVATLAAVSPVPEPERAARERDVVDALRVHVAPGPVLEADAALVRAALAGDVAVPDVRAEVLGVELVALDESSARVVVAYVLRAAGGEGAADGTPVRSEDEVTQELTLVLEGGSWRVSTVAGPGDGG